MSELSRVNFHDFIPEEVRAQIAQYKERTLSQVRANCDFLGIQYQPYLDEHAADIARAAKGLRKCELCPYDLQTALECKQAVSREVMHEEFTRFGVHLSPCKLYRTAARQRQLQHLLGSSGLSKRFLKRTFQNFKATTPELRSALQTCVNFCTSFSENSKGLKLFGGYGCGKTHLAAAIIIWLAEKKGIAGMFASVPDMLESMRAGYEKKDGSAEQVMKAAKEAPVLVLDDLGAEKATDWTRQQLYELINCRYEKELPTVVTTNCAMQELIEHEGQRTASRLVEMTTPVRIKAGDYRIQLAKG